MRKTGLGIVLAFCMIFALPAFGDIIDFSTSVGTSGAITYAGGASPLIGADIQVATVSGTGTPSNTGVQRSITGGILAFTTGAFDYYDASTGIYFFAPGGSITITGTGPGCKTVGGCGGNNPDTTSGPTLLSGTITRALFIAGANELAITAGYDSKDSALLAFYGYQPDQVFQFSGSVQTSLNTSPTGGSFTGVASGSTDIQNRVPDGGVTAMLLGGTLVGFAGLRRGLRV